jgi:hypothetical protein
VCVRIMRLMIAGISPIGPQLPPPCRPSTGPLIEVHRPCAMQAIDVVGAPLMTHSRPVRISARRELWQRMGRGHLAVSCEEYAPLRICAVHHDRIDFSDPINGNPVALLDSDRVSSSPAKQERRLASSAYDRLIGQGVRSPVRRGLLAMRSPGRCAGVQQPTGRGRRRTGRHPRKSGQGGRERIGVMRAP